MGFADNLRNELNNTNAEIIANRFEPRKEEIFNALATGIKRLGYVKIDTFNNTGTREGDWLGVKSNESWWGYSSDGNPDMLTIRV